MNAFNRLAGGYFLTRVFGVARSARLIISSINTLVVLHCFANIVVAFAICRPLRASWNNSVPGTCGDQKLAYLLFEILGMMFDLAVIIFPVWSIGKVQMSSKQKLTLRLVFSAGAM